MMDWHVDVWRERFAGRSLPQSLLLTAPRGSGEIAFARALVQAALCAQPSPSGLGCGHCDDCRWFASDSHPDVMRLDPDLASDEPDSAEEAGAEGSAPAREKNRRKRREIKVNEVRAAGAFLRVAPVRERVRVVMIRPAETLGPAAANALLKDLEEPPAAARFILVSNAPGRLLPTIRSRCVRFALPPPSVDAAARWLAAQGQGRATLALAQTGGMPEAAAALDERYWEVRQQLLERLGRHEAGVTGVDVADTDWPTVVHVTQTWALDILAARFSLPVRYHGDRAEAILAVAGRADPVAVAGFERRVAQARRLLEHPLNVRLQTEELLIESQRL